MTFKFGKFVNIIYWTTYFSEVIEFRSRYRWCGIPENGSGSTTGSTGTGTGRRSGQGLALRGRSTIERKTRTGQRRLWDRDERCPLSSA